MTPRMRNIFAVLCCICLASPGKAQRFIYHASLDTVPHTGFYQIPLTSDIGQHTKTDYRDLRIFDQQHQQIPYILKIQLPSRDSLDFHPLAILQNHTIDSNRSVLVFSNPDTVPLHTLSLRIGNATSQRSGNLSGSTYNEKKDPLHILSVGKYTWQENTTHQYWLSNPSPIFHQVDSSNGISYIRMESGPWYHVERILLYVKGPAYFKRSVRLIVDSTVITTTTLSSDSSLYIDCPPFASPHWSLEIDNGDNPPLEATRIITQSAGKNLVAYLEAGKVYHLEMGSLDASSPQYDLGDFRNRIPDSLPILEVSTVENIHYVGKVIQPNWFNQRWLWAILISVLLLLSLFTYRLVKEMKK